jgi:hypothetical protein
MAEHTFIKAKSVCTTSEQQRQNVGTQRIQTQNLLAKRSRTIRSRAMPNIAADKEDNTGIKGDLLSSLQCCSFPCSKSL